MSSGNRPVLGLPSNPQTAALGRRACFDAGLALPEGVTLLAVKGWRESQFVELKE